MSTHETIERLLAESDPVSQQQLLSACASQWGSTAAATFKAEADRFLRADVARSLRVAQWMQRLAALTERAG
ncbi:MAG: hypothetical protein V9H69_25710 [Anaerolineae bacterium]